jgi:hypothetical protein
VAVPAPLACDGATTYDPATRSMLVKVSGVGASYWRRGHAALMQAETAGSVLPHRLFGRMVPEGNRCKMGGCGFRLTMLLIGSWPARACLRLWWLIRPPGGSWVSSSAVVVHD